MKRLCLVLGLVACGFAEAAPLSLHPENPHYFLFRDKPAVLITSAEHYGAVINRDFDYLKYLDTLAADGLNLTRIFTGAYVEPEGAFHITKNTLAPAPGRFLAPWARSEVPGYARGGNKFDLERWDEAYFARLRDFVAQASRRGIIVEVTLFCPMYEDLQWKISPMNAENNVNDVGRVKAHAVYDYEKNGALQSIQESLVRKIVEELKDADNVCYEICNEPYFGGVTMDWQARIADTIADAEKDFPARHLISQNVANGAKKVERAHPGISIFNFHYAHPPEAVSLNYHLEKAIGLNETGFKGTADDHYRMEAWEFMLAGGALYNHLDYSFTVGHEDGTFQYPKTQPGGGNPGYRKQMQRLAEFLRGFDFLQMKPARTLLRSSLPETARFQMLAAPGREYAAYGKDLSAPLRIELAPGAYRVSWFDVVSGKELRTENIQHERGERELQLPSEGHEWALRIVATQKP